jgi:hypothetical protein
MKSAALVMLYTPGLSQGSLITFDILREAGLDESQKSVLVRPDPIRTEIE